MRCHARARRLRTFTRHAGRDVTATSDEACVGRFISSSGARAFRRPLSEEEVAGSSAGGFNQYHWMVVEAGQALGDTLRSAEPFLQFVTINGSDAAPLDPSTGTRRL